MKLMIEFCLNFEIYFLDFPRESVFYAISSSYLYLSILENSGRTVIIKIILAQRLYLST